MRFSVMWPGVAACGLAVSCSGGPVIEGEMAAQEAPPNLYAGSPYLGELRNEVVYDEI